MRTNQQSTSIPEGYLSVAEAATILGVTDKRVYQLRVALEPCDYIKIGKKFFLSPEALEKLKYRHPGRKPGIDFIPRTISRLPGDQSAKSVLMNLVCLFKSGLSTHLLTDKTRLVLRELPHLYPDLEGVSEEESKNILQFVINLSRQ